MTDKDHVFCSATGNREIWDKKPDGYYTEEEWLAAHPLDLEPKVELAPEELVDIRKSEISYLLNQLDLKLLRPTQAVVKALANEEDPDPEDTKRLKELMAEKEQLREEFRDLETSARQ